MSTQNISFTSPNDEWLDAQVDNEEYTNRSEVVNALIQKARETDSIRMHLIQAEQSGFSQQTRSEASRPRRLHSRILIGLRPISQRDAAPTRQVPIVTLNHAKWSEPVLAIDVAFVAWTVFITVFLMIL